MEMKYIQIFSDKEALLAPFDDAECGRLLLAMLAYGLRGEEIPLSGNERYIWPVFRQMLDASRSSLEKKSKAGSTKGTDDHCASESITTDHSASQEERRESEKFEGKQKESKAPIIQEPRTKNQYTRYNTQEREKGAKPPKSPRASPRLLPPSVEDVEDYCREAGISIDAQAFVDFYTSKGWKVGREKMQDWKAAARNWARRDQAEGRAKPAAEQSTMLRYTKEQRRATYSAAVIDFDEDDVPEDTGKEETPCTTVLSAT